MFFYSKLQLWHHRVDEIKVLKTKQLGKVRIKWTVTFQTLKVILLVFQVYSQPELEDLLNKFADTSVELLKQGNDAWGFSTHLWKYSSLYF